jgi:hypothetical protein
LIHPVQKEQIANVVDLADYDFPRFLYRLLRRLILEKTITEDLNLSPFRVLSNLLSSALPLLARLWGFVFVQSI